ncbi:MAG: glycosyltransferase [Rhodospirillales bacterium]|nr:glycosyltransferase [Rhodospirillales bacterium]
MPLKPCSAAEMLAASDAEKPCWAVFDAAWYRRHYRRDLPALADAAATLEWYLREGQALRHSPNRFFDEAWFLARHRGIADAVGRGEFSSGFDAYCQVRFADRAGHWLFDELAYRRRYPDIAAAIGTEGGPCNAYDEYLREGDRAGRSGSAFFEPELYLQALGGAAATAHAQGAFTHYLTHLAKRVEYRVSPLFDPEWYLARYPEVAAGIGAGVWPNALCHYLTNDTPLAFDPLPWFSETEYAARYPDVAQAIAAGDLRNAYTHFVANGAAELRQPCAALDLARYVEETPGLAAAIAEGRVRDGFRHFLTSGAVPPEQPEPEPEPAASPAVPPPVTPPPVAMSVPSPAAMPAPDRAALLLPSLARAVLDFTCTDAPTLSVIVTMRDGFAATLACLARLREAARGAVELVLVDRGSADATRMIGQFVRGASLMRFETEIGVLRARNAGLLAASAPLVLMLDPAAELAPGSLAAALARLEADAGIGAVAAKMIAPDGRLASAGHMVWRDGTIEAYLAGASALQPEANFVRDVICGDPAFLLARRALLEALEGFDDTLDAPLAAMADLGLRMAAEGARLTYDPGVAVFAASGDDAAENAARPAFFRKHMNALRQRYLPDPRVTIFAREAGAAAPRRLLFIEDHVPLRHIGSGFVRSNDIIRRAVALGWQVSVFPIQAGRADPALIHADLPDRVEVLHDRALADLAGFLAARAGYYDAIWVARTHNLDHALAALKATLAGHGRPPRVILDTEAIVALREAEKNRLAGHAAVDPGPAILQEFAHAHFCQGIVATTEAEAGTLRALGFSDVAVLGHLRLPEPTPRRFADRAGMLFLGAMHEQRSPNYDSLVWFVDAVLPLVEEALGWETRLSIAGFTMPEVDMARFAAHPRITLRGTVADPRPLYDAHRLFVAPTRFAAGTPYKVHEAASFGLPVVATALLARQTGWRHGTELLAAEADDAAGFAAEIVRLYRDEALWQGLRDAALGRIAAEHGSAAYDRVLSEVLQ